MARDTDTTRRVNRQVVEALEGATRAGGRAAMEWISVADHLDAVAVVTDLHNDLIEDANTASARMGEVCGRMILALRDEREGKS